MSAPGPSSHTWQLPRHFSAPSLVGELPEGTFCHHTAYILRPRAVASGVWLNEGISFQYLSVNVLAAAFLSYLGSSFHLWLFCCLFSGPVYLFREAGIASFLPSWSFCPAASSRLSQAPITPRPSPPGLCLKEMQAPGRHSRRR